MTRKIDLSVHDLKLIQKMIKEYMPHRRVVVFGSRVSGTAKPHSDLDLCIMGNEALSLEDFARLREAFSESDLTMRVDIVDWATLTPQFQKIIQEQAVVLC